MGNNFVMNKPWELVVAGLRLNYRNIRTAGGKLFERQRDLLNKLHMIARIWHGKTNIENYESYTKFLKAVAIPDYQKTSGFKGLSFLRNIKGGEGHFNLITYWEDLESIKNFAGVEYTKAKYYPEDDDFLLEFEEEVQHLQKQIPHRYPFDALLDPCKFVQQQSYDSDGLQILDEKRQPAPAGQGIAGHFQTGTSVKLPDNCDIKKV